MALDELGIAIKIDTGAVLPALERVKGGLRETEAQGKTLNESLAGVSGGFKSLAQAIEQEQAALKRMDTIQEQLAVKNSGLVRSFAGLTQALEREQAMLEMIHGPAQKLAQDTQTLDSLMRKGAISATEYTEALAKAKGVQSSGGSGSGGSALAGQLGAGGLSGAAGLAGGAAIAVFGVKELASIDDEYTRLANSATKFTDSGRSVSQIMIDQRKIANDLHQPLEQMMGAFDDVRDATDRLGLSYNEALRTEKTFAEAAKLSGKSTEQLTSEFLALATAFETGGRIAGPLRTLFHDFPDLADHVTQSLGMSEQQIVKFAANGKLGFEKFAAGMRTNTQDIDDKAHHLQATWADLAREGKDALFAPIPDQGTMLDIERWSRLDAAQKKAIEDAERMANALKLVGPALQSIDDLTKQVLKTLDQYDNTLGNIEKHLQHGEYVTAFSHGLGAIVDQTKNYGEAAYKLLGGDDPWDPTKLQDKYNAVKHLTSAVQEFDAGTLAVARDLKIWGGEATVQQAGQAAEALKQLQRGIEDELKREQAAQAEATRRYGEEQTKIFNAQIEQIDKRIESMRDNAKVALDPMKDALKDFITTGHADIEQMFKSIADTGISKLLDAGETSLLQQIFGKTSSEYALNTSFAAGGATAGSEIAGAMTGAGAVVAAQIAGAMAAGAAGNLFGIGGSGYSSGAAIGGLGASDLPAGDIGSIARTGGFSTPTFTPPVVVAARSAPVAAAAPQTKIVNHYNLMYDRRAIISNQDDDERVLSALRRNPPAYQRGRWAR